jgi:hypothetical protein
MIDGRKPYRGPAAGDHSCAERERT